MRKPRPSLRKRAASRRRSPGFTMVELVVAIGVLVLLIGISVAAIGRIMRTNKSHQTAAAMETLRAMVQNYSAVDESLQGLTAFYADIKVGANPGPIPAPPLNGKAAGDDHSISVPPVGTGNKTPMYPAAGTSGESIVWRTYRVMQALNAVPANRALFERVPPEGRFYLKDANTMGQLEPPLLADGFGQPILFVPAVGMRNVTQTVPGAPSGTLTGTIESDGILRNTNLPRGRAASAAALGNQVNPNQRPFWSSGGADYSQAKGDDNVYSFSQ